MDWKKQVNDDLIKNQHYWSRYLRLIALVQSTCPRKKTKIGSPNHTYFESHHIWPEAFGGSDHQYNRILLTAREHFIAHWLLWKATGQDDMTLAFALFSRSKGNKVNSKLYEKLKVEHSRIASQMALGVSPSEETRKKLSAAISGDKHYLKSKPLPEEQKKIVTLSNWRRNSSIWLKAQEYHELWLVDNPNSYLMERKLGLKMYKLANMVERFRSGWVPKEDVLWLSFTQEPQS